jgi:hypothetical protein
LDIPFEILYTVSAGKIVGEGANVIWDLTGVEPGQYTVTAALSLPYGTAWEVYGQTLTKVISIE